MREEGLKPQHNYMEELGIDMKEIERRMSFIGISGQDVTLLSEMEGFARKYSDQVVSAFYQHLLSFRETRLLLKDKGIIDRLIASQKKYLMEIFRGQYDKPYFERRLRIGAVHHRIGLKPKWYMESYSFFENHLSSLIAHAYGHEPDRGLARDQAMRKIFRIDMVLALEYYFHQYYREMDEKLKRNLQEVSDFTRMLSHDLKEPLRGIEAFSSFLLEDYENLLDLQGKRYLNFLRESAVRMKALIEDLLSLVSISRKGPSFESVDLDALLSQVKRDLSFAVQQKDAVIINPSPLPTVRCNRIQLAEVLKNLISNAIKFNNATPPRVEVRVEDQGNLYLLSVKDNGIGIEKPYQNKILLPFERLHPQGEFEGTGMGLAICKKVVENYGGKIWLESKSGVGSTFFFTIPKEIVY